MVEWFWWDSSLIFDDQLHGFLQCFDTVGFVIWSVKIVPGMTYNVLSGTLKTSTNGTNTTVDLHKAFCVGLTVIMAM